MNTVWAFVTRLDDILSVIGFFTVMKWCWRGSRWAFTQFPGLRASSPRMPKAERLN